MRIQKVGVLSLGKTLGAVFAALPIAIGMLLAFFGVAAALVFRLIGSGRALGIEETLLTAIPMIVAGPVIYGLMGFIIGVVSAVTYNFVASRTGGLEIELEVEPPPTMPVVAAASPPPSAS